jgi:thiamine biosynthesis lipoprotein
MCIFVANPLHMKIAFFLFSNLVSAFVCSAQIPVLYLEGEAQGTTYHITYADAQDRNFLPEITALLDAFDQSVSTYQPHSIISRVNANDTAVVLDSTFITCFLKAKEIWENTNGAFDPTVFPLVNAYGFGPQKKQQINPRLIDSLCTFVGFEKIALVGSKIIKSDPRVSLDFNAFAQGYSVDVIARFLRQQGITSYIVEIGGEVYAEGSQPNGDPWFIGIEKPIENKTSSNPLFIAVELDHLGVATSGNYRRFIEENGVKYVHHIDPKTGYPTKNNLLSASVFSKACIVSDATATGLLVLGLEEAKRYLNAHPELMVYLIYSDDVGNYQVYQSPQLAGFLIDVE